MATLEGSPARHPRAPSQSRCIARTASSGSRSIIRSNTAAGPVGRRRSCSQFCSVLTLTPINRAKADCDKLVRSRIARTPVASTTKDRDGSFSPRKIAPPSSMLPNSSSNNLASISKLLFHRFRKSCRLIRREIRDRILGVGQQQQNLVALHCPLVVNSRTAAHTTRPDGHTQLSDAAPPGTKAPALGSAAKTNSNRRYSSSLSRLLVWRVKTEVSTISTRLTIRQWRTMEKCRNGLRCAGPSRPGAPPGTFSPPRNRRLTGRFRKYLLSLPHRPSQTPRKRLTAKVS